MSMATRTETRSPALHIADDHDLIRVHGARENNLKDVSIEIPKRRLTVFTGVSGSGKSSLVFDTIAAESQRLINETYSAFVQGFMPTLARPDVDVLEGLTTAIIVDQQRMGGDIRSTVGTATDASAMLRILFSRLGQPHIGSPNAFSFNVPSVRASGAITVERGGGKTVRKTFTRTGGMCPRCEGLGTVSDIDLAQLFDDSKSLTEGAITIPGYKAGGWNYRLYSASGFFDPDKPIREYTKKEMHDFLRREPIRMKIAGINMTYEGLIPRVQKSILAKDKEAMQPHIRAFVERAVTFTACPGLHLADVEQLLGLLDRIVDSGKSVIVIEHHRAVMAHADWIIDLGPGAGHDGGRIVFEGTPGRPRGSPLHPHRRAPRGLRRHLTETLPPYPSHQLSTRIARRVTQREGTALAEGLRHPVIMDGHAAKDLVLALQHHEALPLEETPGWLAGLREQPRDALLAGRCLHLVV